ncbi:MAG: hypothetical protein ACFBRM_06815 [Pikeienuella sp.]
MSDARSDAPAVLESLIAEGAALLAKERAQLLTGRFDGLARLAKAKQALLEQLEQAIPATPGSPTLKRALQSLVAQSRRNERLLAAARAGVAAARRRIKEIAAARTGDVAYRADGSRVVSREDAAGPSTRA